ncbi:MAG: hypothetical protein LBL21_03960 [Rickettsiales bacterium]|nr:hypothetical protein [Rickettsiales bacterium]
MINRDSWFVIRGGIIIAALFFYMTANRSYAAVGLCVKDDSLAKIRAVNTNNASTSGWEGGHGVGWTARSTNEQYIVDGMSSCLATNAKNGSKPSTWNWGSSCWCNVTRINDKSVSGAWVFQYSFDGYLNCYAHCAFLCSACVRLGTADSCSRSALFAAP